MVSRAEVIKSILARQEILTHRPSLLTPHSFYGNYTWAISKEKLGFANLNAADLSSLDEKTHSVSFTISTADEDRDGDIVNPAGCRLSSYARNPVVFFGHQAWEVPIGTSRAPDGKLAVYPEQKGIKAVCFFDVVDPDADFIYGKVKRGMLNAASLAFVPIEALRRNEVEKAVPRSEGMVPPGWLFLRYDLTEWSIVGVPANAGAIRDVLDSEKCFITPKLQKALTPFAARAKGRCFAGYCPCPRPQKSQKKQIQKGPSHSELARLVAEYGSIKEALSNLRRMLSGDKELLLSRYDNPSSTDLYRSIQETSQQIDALANLSPDQVRDLERTARNFGNVQHSLKNGKKLTGRQVLNYLVQHPRTTHSKLLRVFGYPKFDFRTPLHNPVHKALTLLQRKGLLVIREKAGTPYLVAHKQYMTREELRHFVAANGGYKQTVTNIRHVLGYWRQMLSNYSEDMGFTRQEIREAIQHNQRTLNELEKLGLRKSKQHMTREELDWFVGDSGGYKQTVSNIRHAIRYWRQILNNYSEDVGFTRQEIREIIERNQYNLNELEKLGLRKGKKPCSCHDCKRGNKCPCDKKKKSVVKARHHEEEAQRLVRQYGLQGAVDEAWRMIRATHGQYDLDEANTVLMEVQNIILHKPPGTRRDYYYPRSSKWATQADSETSGHEIPRTQQKDELEDCVSKKIPVLVEEGYDQEQAAAIAYSMCGEKALSSTSGTSGGYLVQGRRQRQKPNKPRNKLKLLLSHNSQK